MAENIKDYINKISIALDFYRDIEKYERYLDNENKEFAEMIAEYIFDKKFQDLLSTIPEEILKAFPINLIELEEKASKTLERLSKSAN